MKMEKTKNYYLSPYKKVIPQSAYKSNLDLGKVKPKEFRGIELAKCEITPIETQTKQFLNASKTVTIYPYSDAQRVYRLDGANGKEIYLQHRNREQIWEAGIGDASWPLYTRGLSKDIAGDTVLFAEGEKVVEHLKSQGFACVTAASHCFNQDSLYKSIYLFSRTFRQIKHAIIIPDDDTPGLHKAEIVSLVMSHFNVGNKIVSMQEIGRKFNLSFEPNHGADLADFDLKLNLSDLCLTT